MLAFAMLIINVVIYINARNSDSVDSNVAIIIASVAIGLVALPLLGFLIFHIYLAVSGRTTREIIKKIKA